MVHGLLSALVGDRVQFTLHTCLDHLLHTHTGTGWVVRFVCVPLCVPAPPGVFLPVPGFIPVKRHRGEPGHTGTGKCGEWLSA